MRRVVKKKRKRLKGACRKNHLHAPFNSAYPVRHEQSGRDELEAYVSWYVSRLPFGACAALTLAEHNEIWCVIIYTNSAYCKNKYKYKFICIDI